MDVNFSCLHLSELENIYQKAEINLQQALLNGEAWEAIQEKREIVTRLAILLHQRKYPLTSTQPDLPFETRITE